MDKPTEQSLWEVLEHITDNLESQRLADVFRFIAFQSGETFGAHKHLRIEINYIKKGSCTLHLNSESVAFREGDIMIITPEVSHGFEAGTSGTTLMQLEFLPEIFSHFNPPKTDQPDAPILAFLFSKENQLIKIVNNIRIMQVVQRIVNELELKAPYCSYLVVMYYAELLILIYRYMSETYLPICNHEALRKAIGYIRINYQSAITITDIAQQGGVSERYLRKLFARHLNLSPVDYINRIRVNKSIELLKHTDLSIKEISFQCGFQSPQYFSRLFKQQTGSSPRQAIR